MTAVFSFLPSFRRAGALVLAMACLLTFQHGTLYAKDPSTPEELYQYGMKMMDRKNTLKAVEVFENIKTTYPFSQFATLAELRVGDAHFVQGEYELAIESYQTFIKLHPKHPELDYVTYRIAAAEFKLAPSIAQRDQTPTRRMLLAIQDFESRFPESEHLEEVKEMRAEGRERLAEGVFGIGQYYYKRARFETDSEERVRECGAAINRFEEVLGTYPDASRAASKSLYHMGRCQLWIQDKAAAQDSLQRLEARYPNSDYAPSLKRHIARARTKAPAPAPVPGTSLEAPAVQEGAAVPTETAPSTETTPASPDSAAEPASASPAPPPAETPAPADVPEEVSSPATPEGSTPD